MPLLSVNTGGWKEKRSTAWERCRKACFLSASHKSLEIAEALPELVCVRAKPRSPSLRHADHNGKESLRLCCGISWDLICFVVLLKLSYNTEQRIKNKESYSSHLEDIFGIVLYVNWTLLHPSSYVCWWRREYSFAELRVYVNQARVGDCWNSGGTNQDGFGEFILF